MNNKSIKKTATKFLKSLKGDMDFVNIQKLVLNYGYKIIFYNTDYGNRELVRYGLNDDALTTNAFTYSGNAKIIFINHNVSPEDKTYLLYHEIGHILLGHFDNHRISTKNKYLLDIEADTFSHYVLNPPKTTKISIVAVIVAVMVMSALSFSLGTAYVGKSAIPVNGITHEEDKVYITSTGTKYHRESCIHIQGRKVFAAERKEAEKTYVPCKVCNP